MDIIDRQIVEEGDKTLNELAWGWRSECCGSPLDIVEGELVCARCRVTNPKVVGKHVLQKGVQIAEIIGGLPGEVRDRAVEGYYKSREGQGISVVHIFDNGGPGQLFDLPADMRR